MWEREMKSEKRSDRWGTQKIRKNGEMGGLIKEERGSF